MFAGAQQVDLDQVRGAAHDFALLGEVGVPPRPGALVRRADHLDDGDYSLPTVLVEYLDPGQSGGSSR